MLNDVFIGFDHCIGPLASQAALSFGAPASVSQYIGNLGDGTNWKERLTSSVKTFAVPIRTTAVTFSGLPTCNSSAEGEMRAVTDSTTNTWGATIGGLEQIMSWRIAMEPIGPSRLNKEQKPPIQFVRS